MSANLRSSKMRKSCCSLSTVSRETRSASKSVTMSMWVCQPVASAQLVGRTRATDRVAHLDHTDLVGYRFDDTEESGFGSHVDR